MMSRYIVRERLIREVNFGDIESKKIAVILEEIKMDDGNIVEIPSALNSVIYSKYKNKSISNSKNVAITICEFLNYLKEECKVGDDEKFTTLKEDGVYGLNFYHLACFLNFCITKKNNTYDTIKQKELRLFYFYDYLIKVRLLKSNVKFTYKIAKDSSGKRHKVMKSPCNMLEYPVSYPSIYKKKEG